MFYNGVDQDYKILLNNNNVLLNSLDTICAHYHKIHAIERLVVLSVISKNNGSLNQPIYFSSTGISTLMVCNTT